MSHVRVLRLAHGEGLSLPAYQSAGAAGADICAAVETPLVLAPGERALVPTGLAFEIEPGFEIQVRPRSGLAARHGVTLVNSPGTIDCDYRGEVKIVLINLGTGAVTITRGERIAQLVLAPVIQARFEEVHELDASTRGEGGFGSTGR